MERTWKVYDQEFDKKYFYNGADLGAVYTPEKTVFRVWSPEAERMELCLYAAGDGDTLISTEDMKRGKKGTWYLEVEGDKNKTYYTYRVTIDGKTTEAVDPYAKALGVNGERGMVVDLAATNPEGFADEKRPEMIPATDAVIYEAHVRDLTVDASAGVSREHQGKFLGVAERGTVNSANAATGIDYMKQLGVTHLQLLPIYDYATVDERNPEGQYNWGYDPMNYNAPEGSYSTDPYHGEVRIRELKTLVGSLHAAGIRVIMDVVYNHTYNIEDFCFQKLVPDYFFRTNENGYSDGSACGNETASERRMVRKFIVESVAYWAREYHLDGFRFDLMGILDIETMRAIRKALDEIDPGILLYGEGWTGGPCALEEDKRAMKKHTWRMKRIGAFSDDIRDGIKGSVFFDDRCGFVNGAADYEQAIRFGVVGATRHPQVHFDNEAGVWAGQPEQCINYVSCHDNYALWDKLQLSRLDADREQLLAMNRMAAAIIYTSQGVPLMQAGEEILRSRPEEEAGCFCENGYNRPDTINRICWDLTKEQQEMHDYYQGLIAFRKAHPGLRLRTAKEVRSQLKFLRVKEKNMVAYRICENVNSEIAQDLLILYNANEKALEWTLPDSDCWQVHIDGTHAGTTPLYEVERTITIPPLSVIVMVKPAL